MVIEELLGEGDIICACGECGFKYTNKKWAEKCEKYCKGHKKCSIEIVKHAMNYKDKKK